MSRSCRPLWLTCATLPDHLDMADLCLRCPAPLPCVQVLALLAGTAQLLVRQHHLADVVAGD